MESPTQGKLIAEPQQLVEEGEGLQPEKGICDEDSIAFGVMYFPRTRVQRTEQTNCDTRVLREPLGDDGLICHYIDAGPELARPFALGFVK